MITDNGTMKLHRSLKVKTFIKGLEFFQIIADVAEAEGISCICMALSMWNHCFVEILMDQLYIYVHRMVVFMNSN